MNRYKSWNLAFGIWLLAVSMLLTVACSGDSGQSEGPVVPEPAPTPTPTPTPTEPESALRLVAATRATGIGISDAAAEYETFSPIQIFLMSGSEESAINQRREGQFIYDDETAPAGWKSTIGLKDAYHCIYGYSPGSAAACSISPLSGSSYKDGAILSMSNLSAASGSDLCVIVGVRHGSTAAAADVLPDRGKFDFMKTSENYVSLLLDHLFARIDFRIRIGEEYSKMRFVRVKKLELRSAYELTGVTVRLSAATTDVSYTTAAVAAAGSSPTGTLYDFTTDAANSIGKDLSVEGTVFPGFFAPDANNLVASGLTLVCTYDVYVYDALNNKIGSRVREDCVAVNSLSGITGLTSLARGQKTSINLTVEPTYLYQLSEDEINNPGIKIN